MKKRIVYAGTPEFATAPLKSLLAHPQYGELFDVVGVYTQPDRPAGRGRKLQFSPVKQCALDAGIEVFQPLNFKEDEDFQSLVALKPDLMVVTAYGVLLPENVLNLPSLGCVNLHASLLPRWRGAAPIQRAIEAGDEQTGITLMQMDKGLDTGAMLAKVSTDISEVETAQSLHDRLSDLGAQLLIDSLSALLNGDLSAQAQNEEQANYAKKLSKTEAQIDWTQPATDIARKVRAMNPWPVCFTRSARTKLDTIRVWMAHAVGSSVSGVCGEVVACGSEGVDVQTGDGILRVTQLQIPGGKSLSAKQFANAYDLAGEQLGDKEPTQC